MNTYRKLTSHGFVSLHIVLILLLLIVVGAGYGVYSARNHKNAVELSSSTSNTKGIGDKVLADGANSKQIIAAIHATTTGGASISASSPSSPTSKLPSTSSGSSASAATAQTQSSTYDSSPSMVGPPTSSSSGSSTNTATYLVTGTFIESPTSPMCSPSVPCSAPIANHTVIVNPYCAPTSTTPCGTKALITTTTNAQGQFTLHLSINHYTLTLSPAVGISGQSWSFNEIGQPLQLQLTDQTGIR